MNVKLYAINEKQEVLLHAYKHINMPGIVRYKEWIGANGLVSSLLK